MRNIVISLLVVAWISGCSTTPFTPKPHNTKYAFQCLLLTSPDSLSPELISDSEKHVDIPTAHMKGNVDLLDTHYTTNTPVSGFDMPAYTHSQIKELLMNPNVDIDVFPVVYAGIGESVTNDQTKIVEMRVDADIVNGEVIYKKKPRKLGKEFSITFNKVEGTNVTFTVHLRTSDLLGVDKFKVEGGQEVEIPSTESRFINSEVTQPIHFWTTTGCSGHTIDDEPMMYKMFLFRVIPPTINK